MENMFPFGLNLSKNSKFSVYTETRYLGYFKYIKFNGDGHVAVFDIFW